MHSETPHFVKVTEYRGKDHAHIDRLVEVGFCNLLLSHVMVTFNEPFGYPSPLDSLALN